MNNLQAEFEEKLAHIIWSYTIPKRSGSSHDCIDDILGLLNAAVKEAREEVIEECESWLEEGPKSECCHADFIDPKDGFKHMVLNCSKCGKPALSELNYEPSIKRLRSKFLNKPSNDV